MSKKQKILVYMSGGVDSSVTAALLVKAGYDVTGAFMVDYDDPERPGNCWRGDYEDALRVCAKLGIKLLRLDFVKEYKKLVLDYLYREYEAGRTPNPDVLCNKFIKFGVWMDKAGELGFDKVATGHYARLSSLSSRPSVIPAQAGIQALYNHKQLDSRFHGNDSVCLLQAKDKNKDQTYFLHQLSQEQLQYVLFPLGEYTKPEVRKLAKKFNLPNADKEESMGICFVGEVPMKEFLQKRIKPKKGNIVLSPTLNEGEVGGGVSVVGEHDGPAFYTIGQRIGIQHVIPDQDSGSNRLTFVVGKNIENNTLIVGYEDDALLYKNEIEVKEVNWISGHSPKFPIKCKIRLRHRQELQDTVVCLPLAEGEIEMGSVLLKFTKSQRAPTPGQFAVFYVKDECLGGGIINI